MMCRTELADDRGMLFLFDRERVQSFWMKNTLIPLDMIFVDENWTVVGVVPRAEPLTLSPRAVEGPSRYVLEVNGGFAEQHGVAIGAALRFTPPDSASGEQAP